MRYALYLPNFGPFGDARTLADLARDAEEAGWDGFFLWDHIAGLDWPAAMVDPWVALSAIALQTRRIKIGALVTPIPRRRPWKLARETASLAQLSGGRLVVGVGIGGGAGEWGDLGEEPDPRARGAMLDEGLEVLAGLWSGEPFSFAGRHYQVRAAQFLPACRPRPPVWVAGWWPHRAPLRRAARWDGMFPLFACGGPAELEALGAAVAFARAQRRGDAPFDVVYAGRPTPGDDPLAAAAAVAPYADAGVTWWLEHLTPFAFDAGMEQPWPLERMVRRIRQGPPPQPAGVYG